MAESNDQIPKINPSEVETLINKIEQSNLDEQDKKMIARLLRTFLYLVHLLQEKKVTLFKLKELVFGKKSEKRKREEGEKGEAKDGPGNGVSQGGDSNGNPTPKNEKREGANGKKPGRKPGHGRLSAADYPGARRGECRHSQLASGKPCPKLNCHGKVYWERPHQFIQFTLPVGASAG